MALKLNEKYLGSFISKHEYDSVQPLVSAAHRRLNDKTGAGAEMLGWKDLPENYDKEEFARILAAAEKIRSSCDVFLVLGIGGSYLGARAVIEFVKSPLYNLLPRENAPEIYFSGCNISATSIEEILTLCEGKDVCINVISKSGTTTETAVAFRIFREMLVKKYGESGARERIFVTTDKEKGTLKEFATAKGYETFVVPDDVGGRFSVLTAVGLLPIAVAGIDVAKMMEGANAARLAYTDEDLCKNDCYKYAAIRNILYRKGRVTEILVGYEPYMTMMNEWWKQLFGESEGKDQKGIFPASVIFSTDLHSLGQYIQDGLRNQFETVISIKDSGSKMPIPYDPANVDGLNFLSGMDLCEVNSTAMKGTLLAHIDGGVPNVLIELEDRREYSLGYLIYFFELACAISGYLLAVNPFNQPGVEAYKKNMFALLGKPGYEEMRGALEARLKE